MNKTLFISLIVLITCRVSYSQEHRTYYDEAKLRIKEIVEMEGRIPQGRYTSFLQNGIKNIEGYYQKGQPDSTWTYFFENGEIKAQGELHQGFQSGVWNFYYESGSIKSSGDHLKGLKNGNWVDYFENGDKKSLGSYLFDKKNGMWKYFAEGGFVKAETYFDYGIGSYKEYHPGGAIKMEGQIRNEKSEGMWKYYYPDGSIQSQGNYENGLRTGRWTNYYQKGGVQSEGNYEKGKRSGNWDFFYETGSISSRGILENDKREGVWNLFFESGEPRGIEKYTHGRGQSTEYYPSGEVLAKGDIEEGKKVGKWQYFDRDGTLNGAAEFVDGIGDFTGYYPSGAVKMTGTLENNKQIGEWILYDADGAVSGKYFPLSVKSDSEEISSSVKSSNTWNWSLKPEYRYKTKSLRYFLPVINEFRGIALATNPIWMATGQLPISMEYFIQERLGYEAQFTILREPFFPTNDSQLGEVTNSGFEIKLKQKFYSKDTKMGMIHFGHNLVFRQVNYNVDILTPTAVVGLEGTETIAAYGVFVGMRWQKSPRESGFTVDPFIGVDVGLRNWSRSTQRDPSGEFDTYFLSVDKGDLYLPLVFGINFGWIANSLKIKKIIKRAVR